MIFFLRGTPLGRKSVKRRQPIKELKEQQKQNKKKKEKVKIKKKKTRNKEKDKNISWYSYHFSKSHQWLYFYKTEKLVSWNFRKFCPTSQTLMRKIGCFAENQASPQNLSKKMRPSVCTGLT